MQSHFCQNIFDIGSKVKEEIGFSREGTQQSIRFRLLEQSPSGFPGYTCRQAIGVLAVTTTGLLVFC